MGDCLSKPEDLEARCKYLEHQVQILNEENLRLIGLVERFREATDSCAKALEGIANKTFTYRRLEE